MFDEPEYTEQELIDHLQEMITMQRRRIVDLEHRDGRLPTFWRVVVGMLVIIDVMATFQAINGAS